MPPARILLASSLVLASLGCATPAPPPLSPKAAAVGVRVKIAISLLPDRVASTAYFMRLDDEGEAVAVLASNYVNGDYVYLLNAEPGHYALIAATFFVDRQHNTAQAPVSSNLSVSATVDPGKSLQAFYATRTLFDETRVTLGPGDLAFLGEIVLDDKGDWNSADATQQRSYDLLAPGHREKNLLLKGLSGQHHSASRGHEVDRGERAWTRFLERSREALAGTGWEGRLTPPVATGPQAVGGR